MARPCRAVRRGRRITPAEAAPVGAAWWTKLGAAHTIGVVHLDVETGEHLPGRGLVPKLLDFSVAKSADVVTRRRGARHSGGNASLHGSEAGKGLILDGRDPISTLAASCSSKC